MNKYWISVFVATIFEVIWVIGLKYSTTILEWLITLLCIGFTFVLLTFANKKLPISTSYTVFTGIGTVGTILVDVAYFDEKITLLKVFFIVILIVGVIGLKIVTTAQEVLLEREKI